MVISSVSSELGLSQNCRVTRKDGVRFVKSSFTTALVIFVIALIFAVVCLATLFVPGLSSGVQAILIWMGTSIGVMVLLEGLILLFHKCFNREGLKDNRKQAQAIEKKDIACVSGSLQTYSKAFLSEKAQKTLEILSRNFSVNKAVIETLLSISDVLLLQKNLSQDKKNLLTVAFTSLDKVLSSGEPTNLGEYNNLIAVEKLLSGVVIKVIASAKYSNFLEEGRGRFSWPFLSQSAQKVLSNNYVLNQDTSILTATIEAFLPIVDALLSYKNLSKESMQALKKALEHLETGLLLNKDAYPSYSSLSVAKDNLERTVREAICSIFA